MSRTVTALFDDRADAETARGRLASQVRVETVRILAKETAAAVEDLKLDPKHAQSVREALLGGNHLLVAKVARGEKPELIIDVLAGKARPAPEAIEPVEPIQSFEVVDEAPPERPATEEKRRVEAAEPVASSPAPEAPLAAPDVREEASSAAPGMDADAGEEIRVGEPQVARGGARLRSTTRDEPAEAEIALKEERVELENRSVGRRLTDEEVEAGGLLKDRMFEVVEMREEPVISKETVVREEVIIRKTRHERNETVRDTVRRTRIDLEELSSS